MMQGWRVRVKATFIDIEELPGIWSMWKMLAAVAAGLFVCLLCLGLDVEDVEHAAAFFFCEGVCLEGRLEL